MHKLISALGSGRAVVFYGAGPSTEAGLPDWESLATAIADAAKATAGELPDSIYGDIAAHRFPKAIGDIQRALEKRARDGRGLVERTVAASLADTGRTGSIYQLMAGLPVRLFLTTNLDSVFERHLREKRIPPAVFTNSRDSLEELDPASFDRSIIHVHGSLEAGGAFVLSDSDYARVLHAEEFKPLRLTIESHLVNSAIVVLGYSLSDPDLRAVARSVAATVRRRHPVLALVADADEEAAAQFSREFNIEVIPYSSAHGHREIIAMLSTTTKWLEAPQVATVTDEASLRATQILYVYDAAASPGAPALLAAAKSLILVALRDSKTTLQPSALREGVESLAAARLEDDLFAQAMGNCVSEGLAVDDGEHVLLTDAGNHRVEVANRKYGRLWDNLADHALIAIGDIDGVRGLLESVLIDLFSKRAGEAVGLAVMHQPIETSSLGLFELISQRALGIPEPYTRLRFVEYVIEMLRRPNSTQLAVIEHLGRSLFCAHAMRADASAHATLSQIVANRALLLDSNLLIPLVARRSPRSEAMADLLRLCQENDLAPCTTHGFAQEVLIHAAWARRFGQEHSADDDAMLAAASGFSPYDGNDFLSGLIVSSNESGRKQGLEQYLAECLGRADPDMNDLRELLESKWGIRLITSRESELISGDYARIESDTRAYVAQNAAASKSETRVRTEAEAYSIVHEWTRISESLGLPPDVAVLSSGGYLNHIATDGPHRLGRNVTTTPYALSAVITTYLNSSAVHDFGTIVRSEFFNAASDFIEEEHLERYFSSVISAADRAYEEQLRPRLLQLEAELIPDDLPDTLQEVPPIQRPGYARGLFSVVVDYSSAEQVNRLRKEKSQAEKRADEATQRADGLDARLKKRQKREARYQRRMGRRKKG